MSIEFQCIRCWELVTVEEGTEETDAICPHCQKVQRVPGYRPPEPLVEAVGPGEVPQPMEVSPDSQPGSSRRGRRQAVLQRLKLPVKICQWMLIIPLLMLLLMLVMGIGMYLEGGRRIGYPDLAIWVLLTLVSVYLVVALYGLGHAGRLGNFRWAVIGVTLTLVIGLNYLLVLPFAIWAMVILYDPGVRKAFDK